MRTFLFRSAVLLTTLFILTACSAVVTDSNYLLESGQVHRGSLFIPSANVTLAQDSEVTGSVYVLCCNVLAGGRVDNDIFLLSGNLTLGPGAQVGGDVSLPEGNLLAAPGASIEGEIVQSLTAGLIWPLVLTFCVLPGLILGLGLWLTRAFVQRRRRKAIS